MATHFFGIFVQNFLTRPTSPLLFSVLLLAIKPVGAATESQLPEVTVTATRTPTLVHQNLAEVTVLGRSQIERATGRSVVELLAQQPGLQISTTGGLGQSGSVFIRGLEGRHTLVLVDGVRYGSATLGTPVLDNLSLDNIDRIEIVRGPMSALYGSDAVAGVVQIFTRRGRSGLQGNASLGVGSHRYANASAGVSWGDALWDGAVQAAHVQTRSFSATNASVPFGSFNPDNDGFRQNSGSAQLGLKLGGDWRLGARAFQARGTNHLDDGLGADAKAKLLAQVASLELSGSALPKWKTVTRAAHSVDENTSLESASPYVTLGTFATKQLQLMRQDSVQTPLGEALVVAEYLRQSVQTPDNDFAVTQRRVLGLSAGLQGQEGEHTWQGSVRHDRNSQFGKQNNGALGYGWDLAPQWRVGASLGTSFKAPSFNDLYYPGFGNPDLKPEQGKSLELSVRYRKPDHQLRAAFFEHRIESYITTGPSAFNVKRARIDGVTLSYEGKVCDSTVSAALEHVDPFNQDAPTGAGRVLPRRAKNSMKASWERAWGAFKFGTTLQALGHRFDDVNNQKQLGGYTVLDVRAEWRLAPEWSLAAHLNNLANKHYETAAGYNQPGREAYLSLRYAVQ
jgi:vitamin B12 transporter